MDSSSKLLPELKLDARQAWVLSRSSKPYRRCGIYSVDARADYYTVHGENASFIAKTYYCTTTALRQLGNGTNCISSVSVSRNMFENIARDLLLDRTDYTIEIYEGSGSNWRLTKAGTPGNIGFFEEILFANNDMQDAPVTIALFPNLRETNALLV
ncbi:hypothetical protein HPP92_018511 [Vanilla planifolia]|uniref:DNA mismatch repair protein MutS-like N-terminal domain-containing protein n=1 Tax=Vanilla planifolia TaxID=51239 RepID=A0A835UPG0_VANPL|nr:hypothetical protein HPP92_018511 [Vanilla planifolia]